MKRWFTASNPDGLMRLASSKSEVVRITPQSWFTRCNRLKMSAEISIRWPFTDGSTLVIRALRMLSHGLLHELRTWSDPRAPARQGSLLIYELSRAQSEGVCSEISAESMGTYTGSLPPNPSPFTSFCVT